MDISIQWEKKVEILGNNVSFQNNIISLPGNNISLLYYSFNPLGNKLIYQVTTLVH